MITMTLPQSRRREVVVHGQVIKLSGQVHALVELLVLRSRCIVPVETIIEYIWPNPDFEPDWAATIVSVLLCRARQCGVPLETHYGRGYSLPTVSALRLAA